MAKWHVTNSDNASVPLSEPGNTRQNLSWVLVGLDSVSCGNHLAEVGDGMVGQQISGARARKCLLIDPRVSRSLHAVGNVETVHSGKYEKFTIVLVRKPQHLQQVQQGLPNLSRGQGAYGGEGFPS